MRLRIAGVGTSTSHAATRPAPSSVGSSCWVTMPCSATDSCTRTCCCCCGREHVDDAVDRLRRVLRVQGGEDEVARLAAVSAVSIVSRSRISPTRITSGSWRSAPFSAPGKDWASDADLALVDDALLVRCRNSIGSSIVRMCSSRVRVDLVDDPGERGRLARPRRARDEDQAARPAREVVEDGREAERLDARQLLRISRNAAEIAWRWYVRVHAEAGDAGDRVGEVELPVRLEALTLIVREDRVDDLARRRPSSGPGTPRAARGDRGRG